jgi:hypothetical protein
MNLEGTLAPVEAELIGGSVGQAPSHAATRESDGEAAVIVFSAAGFGGTSLSWSCCRLLFDRRDWISNKPETIGPVFGVRL